MGCGMCATTTPQSNFYNFFLLLPLLYFSTSPFQLKKLGHLFPLLSFEMEMPQPKDKEGSNAFRSWWRKVTTANNPQQVPQQQLG